MLFTSRLHFVPTLIEEMLGYLVIIKILFSALREREVRKNVTYGSIAQLVGKFKMAAGKPEPDVCFGQSSLLCHWYSTCGLTPETLLMIVRIGTYTFTLIVSVYYVIYLMIILSIFKNSRYLLMIYREESKPI